eukprot:gnl/TRDRNA2_/TRDRNA2_136859_c0_seq1.p2 gnl/TRDRNA2_/TRDRNA2_136859_c0~~gnl/TRDRNA2_/TRDRNA2_136859_c0_seq1.p2  ORF type:complete len:113 (+),score=3.22 gnl/TRDRNA2_/TRDRNA2_136859_c0_seq1:253-591(+)
MMCSHLMQKLVSLNGLGRGRPFIALATQVMKMVLDSGASEESGLLVVQHRGVNRVLIQTVQSSLRTKTVTSLPYVMPMEIIELMTKRKYQFITPKAPFLIRALPTHPAWWLR